MKKDILILSIMAIVCIETWCFGYNFNAYMQERVSVHFVIMLLNLSQIVFAICLWPDNKKSK